MMSLASSSMRGVDLYSSLQAHPATGAPPTVHHANRKVLLVDDMLINRVVIGSMLRRAGLDVVEATNGVECLDQILLHGAAQFACIFLDLNMPILDGWKTAERLRSMEAGSCTSARLPIVVCTAEELDSRCFSREQSVASGRADIQASVSHGPATGLKAVACGIDEFMSKPMRYCDLCAILEKYIPCFELPIKQQATA